MSTFVLTIFRGNTRRINHAVTRGGVAENLTGATLRFTVKRKLSDAYTAALIRKDNGGLGGVTITNAMGGLAQTLINPADTVALCADGKRAILFYDLELQTAGGDIETVEFGQFIVDPEVTNP